MLDTRNWPQEHSSTVMYTMENVCLIHIDNTHYSTNLHAIAYSTIFYIVSNTVITKSETCIVYAEKNLTDPYDQQPN